MPCYEDEEFNTSVLLPIFPTQFLLDVILVLFSSSMIYSTTSNRALKSLFCVQADLADSLLW
jgi:hypothetical protein